MLFRTPHYYDDFKCTADKCTDNCCIGWEIEIDSQTDAFYSSLNDGFGRRLKNDIVRDGVPHFNLKNNRCAFLNENNLCDIILSLGEKRLCHICREHPRFYNRYENLLEGGVGLCCEAAATLILSDSSPLLVTEKTVDADSVKTDNELFAFLVAARELILKTAVSSAPFSEKAAQILDFSENLQQSIDSDLLILPPMASSLPAKATEIDGIVDFLMSLEFLEEENRRLLLAAQQNKAVFNEKFLTNIFVYFIRRYFLNGVFSGEILSCVKFAFAAAATIARMAQNDSLSAFVYAAKKFSKEFEYSDTNLEKILDATYEQPPFKTENLKGLFIQAD